MNSAKRRPYQGWKDGEPFDVSDVEMHKWITASEDEREKMSAGYYQHLREKRYMRIAATIVFLSVLSFVTAGAYWFPGVLVLFLIGLIITGFIAWGLLGIWGLLE